MKEKRKKPQEFPLHQCHGSRVLGFSRFLLTSAVTTIVQMIKAASKTAVKLSSGTTARAYLKSKQPSGRASQTSLGKIWRAGRLRF
jgi:hypothetical protein